MKKLMTLLSLGAALCVSHVATAQDMGATKSGGKAAMCIGCHGIPGYKVAYPKLYHVPFIAGQNAKYIENALIAYKSGERKHPTMVAIAASLSEKEMKELAAYYAGAGAAK
jgi:cytochrome c553